MLPRTTPHCAASIALGLVVFAALLVPVLEEPFWRMKRNGLLGNLMIAHGVTNLALSLFVMATERGRFWM